jgi:MFS transporter, AAHS family, 4-hydroxybenzoate transporter
MVEVNIASIVDRTPFGAYRTYIVGICFLIVLMDGFDTQVVGFTAPAISSSLAIPITAFGQVFSVGLFGAMLGAFALGSLADRFGRRGMLIGSVILFSLCSLLTPRAPDLFWLLLCRFSAGLGLGGAIPNLLALASEYAPKRIRGLLTGVLYAGFPLGGVAGALVSAQLLPRFGWPALFYLGGTIPLFLAVAAAGVLPESLQFLLRRPNGQRTVAAIVRRIRPETMSDEAIYADPEDGPARLPVRDLFADGRAALTLLLWVAFSLCFMLLIVLVLWMPALLRGAGIGGSEAALCVGLVNLGSVAGTALGGRLVDRYESHVVLPLLFVASAFAIGPLGYATGVGPLLGLFAALSGFLLGAGSAGLLALAVLVYPSAMRATGVGWAMAFGRMGQVAGPLVIGALLARGLTVDRIFLWCAPPALCAACATLLLCRCGLRRTLTREAR